MVENMFQRKIGEFVAARLAEPRRFLQVLTGPRQTGKTTLARQVMANWEGACVYASADEPTLREFRAAPVSHWVE